MDSALQGSSSREQDNLVVIENLSKPESADRYQPGSDDSNNFDDLMPLQQFSAISQQFIDSYNHLNQQVQSLREDLVRQTAEKRRKAQESESLAKKLQVVLATLPNGVVVIDGHGLVQQANSVAVDMLGEPLEGVAWIDIIARAFAPKSDDGHEISLHDGRRVKVDTQAIGSEPGQVITLTDLTETRRRQETLSREQRLSAMGQMMASLAHQIRTPLSSALLYSGHLNSPRLDGNKKQEFHRHMLQSLKQLEHKVSDMLLFASGGNATAQRFSTAELIRSLQDDLLNNVYADIDIEMTVSVTNTDELNLFGNQQALCGAIGNLLDNSLHACRDNQQRGRLTSIEVDIQTANEQRLLVSVKDNGCGLSLDQINDIFEPFHTGKARGTGLGLAVVKTVVSNFKGQVEVSATPGQGAKFTISLPLINQSIDMLDPKLSGHVSSKR